MTEFNSFDPNKKVGGTNFNANKRSNGKAEDAPAPEETGAVAHNYTQMSSEELFRILSLQAKQNLPIELQHPSITNSIQAFTNAVSPERHARVSRIFKEAYTQEFGREPNEETLQQLVDDYFIGHVAIA